MKVIITKDINRCWHECPHFRTTMDGMSCGHPYWGDKNSYANLLDRDEVRNNVYPKSCPLLKGK